MRHLLLTHLMLVVSFVVEVPHEGVFHLDHRTEHQSKLHMELIRVHLDDVFFPEQTVHQQVELAEVFFYSVDLHKLI